MRFLKTLLAGLVALALFSGPALPAGTIYGLGLSQQLNSNGEPYSGAQLYLYEAGTSTPVTTYQDFGLTSGLEHPWPIVADAAGRIPAFWVADGAYRVRLTDANGVEIFDENSITAVGASSGTGGGSGGVGDSQIFQTGDPICTFSSGTRTGWVRSNSRTIGSSSSGATERAAADVEALFEFLWNNCADTDCPVSTGRGASAAADWASNKAIGTPDMRGRMLVGDDTMGSGSAAGVVADADVIAESGGSESTTDVAAHTHTGPSHTHTFSDNFTTDLDTHFHGYTTRSATTSVTDDGGTQQSNVWFGGGSSATTGDDSHNHSGSVSGTTSASGTGDTGSTGVAAMSLMNPYRVCTWYLKL